MTLDTSGAAAPDHGTTPTAVRDLWVSHLRTKRDHERPVARAQACERFVRNETWIQVDDDGKPVFDPETGAIRTQTKKIVYFCRGRDCPCTQCQSATAKRSAKETKARVRLGWKHAQKNDRAVFALSISPPYDKRSLRRALVDGGLNPGRSDGAGREFADLFLFA